MKTPIRLLLVAVLTGLMYLVPTQNNELMAQRNCRGNGYGNGHNQAQKQQQNYLSIPGITENQKQKISTMQTKHQSEMTVLRNEKRNTRVMNEKDAVDVKMTAKISKHKEAIKALLTPEQKKYFDQNCATNQRQQIKKGNRNNGNRNGNGRNSNRRNCR